MSERYPELDLLRSIAIICMIVYHTSYDLVFFYEWDMPVISGSWRVLAYITAILFLLLVGMCFSIVASREKNLADLWKKQVNRFFLLMGCAGLVTLSTYFSDPSSYVRFGILHLISFSMLILPFILPLKEKAFIPGLLLIIMAQWTAETDFFQPLSLVMGFPPFTFTSVDYFPLLPWLGFVLIGFRLGHFLYVRSTAWREGLPLRIPHELTWLSRHSLLIYMIHQLIILSFLYLFSKMT